MSITTIREDASAKGTGKRWHAKLISADVWGSSAFYPAEILIRDAAIAFPIGTKMFENHITESEQWERPVGDVTKLVGKLISPGEYLHDHEEGPGVYADVEFYDSYVERINEIGDDIGLSVDGAADYVEGERDGRYGKIVTGIPFIRSVDVVVAGGAGGKLITIKESAGPMAGTPVNNEGDQSMSVTKEELTDALKSAFSEFGAQLTKIQESLEARAPEGTVSTTEAPAEPQAEAPAATDQVAAEPVATTVVEPVEPKEDDVEVDYEALVSAVVAAGLPAEVVGTVVKDVRGGDTVDAAIAKQTTIREAYVASANPGTFRIVEAARTNTDAPKDLRSGILANFK